MSPYGRSDGPHGGPDEDPRYQEENRSGTSLPERIVTDPDELIS